MSAEDYFLETQLMHADRASRGSNVVPPIYQASTFSFEDARGMAAGASTPGFERFYTRYGNPNHADVERILAAIEDGEAAMATASGMSAISATAIALTKSGDHVVAQRMIYSGTRALLNAVLARYGVDVTFVDQSDPAAFEAALRPNTTLVMLETPSNPLLGITDIETIAAIAHARGALVSVDNTIATPVNQQPLLLGADIVLHSATKYLGGHSDLIAGVVVASRALIDRIWDVHHILGATLGPIDAWLLVRGLRTLQVRVERHNANAMAIATHLAAHPRVRRVFYPGLVTHAGHEIARSQMNGYGGLLSFELDGDFARTARVVERLRLIHNAVSLGGVESLIAQPAAMWPELESNAEAAAYGVIPSMLRLSVGIERAEDLIADLDQALA
jgi:cystathionine beta-lyase/cystathionine gamma-synthase